MRYCIRLREICSPEATQVARQKRFGRRGADRGLRRDRLCRRKPITSSVMEGFRVAKARTPGWLRVAVIAPALGLYVVACLRPAAAFSVASNDSESTGLGLLLLGWMDGPQACLPWSSNFLWLAAVVLVAVGLPGWAWGCAAVGLLFASRVLLPYPGAVLLEAKYWWLGSYAALAAGRRLRGGERPVVGGHPTARGTGRCPRRCSRRRDTIGLGTSGSPVPRRC